MSTFAAAQLVKPATLAAHLAPEVRLNAAQALAPAGQSAQLSAAATFGPGQAMPAPAMTMTFLLDPPAAFSAAQVAEAPRQRVRLKTRGLTPATPRPGQAPAQPRG